MKAFRVWECYSLRLFLPILPEGALARALRKKVNVEAKSFVSALLLAGPFIAQDSNVSPSSFFSSSPSFPPPYLLHLLETQRFRKFM